MRKIKHTKCIVEGCEIDGNINKHGTSIFIKGYCTTHYKRLYRYGDVTVDNRPGLSNNPIYRTWLAMISRCTNPRNVDYKRYGGRGITVCDRWLNSFENFFADMGERPKGTTLDRKENDKGYSKENCRWATIHQQCANRRSSNKCVGVHFDKLLKKFRPYLNINRKRMWLGIYENYSDAVTARKQAELKYLNYNL